jgi:hypothetical protein
MCLKFTNMAIESDCKVMCSGKGNVRLYKPQNGIIINLHFALHSGDKESFQRKVVGPKIFPELVNASHLFDVVIKLTPLLISVKKLPADEFLSYS